jgi:hypothetical protein
MIVVGLDVHKHSLTAVAVDELGRALAERSGSVDGRVVEWARSLDGARLWAVEDCRQLDQDCFSFIATPAGRLVARRSSGRQRLESELDDLRPPIDRLLPAREVIGVDDACVEALRQPRSEAALARTARTVDGNDPRLDSRRRPRRANGIGQFSNVPREHGWAWGAETRSGEARGADQAAVASAFPSAGGRLCLRLPSTSSCAACWSWSCSSAVVSGRRSWRFSSSVTSCRSFAARFESRGSSHTIGYSSRR